MFLYLWRDLEGTILLTPYTNELNIFQVFEHESSMVVFLFNSLLTLGTSPLVEGRGRSSFFSWGISGIVRAHFFRFRISIANQPILVSSTA